MEEKVFEGQYNGEKILRRTHPSRAFFFFEHFGLFVMYFGIFIVLILVGIFAHHELIAVYHTFAVLILILYFFHFRFLHKNTRYTFTSRRCIFFIRKSLFKRYYNEIHITDLRHAIPKKAGLLGMIFGYGTLILVDKDEKKITYSGIREQQQMSRYLGRIMDHIKTHGHTDDFTTYMHADERKEYKKNLNK